MEALAVLHRCLPLLHRCLPLLHRCLPLLHRCLPLLHRCHWTSLPLLKAARPRGVLYWGVFRDVPRLFRFRRRR